MLSSVASFEELLEMKETTDTATVVHALTSTSKLTMKAG
jgi:hypothetical protein